MSSSPTTGSTTGPERAGRRIPIALAIPTLAGWGAERFLVSLAGALDPRRFRPLLICSSAAGPLGAEIDPDIPVYDLGRKSRASFPRLVLRLAGILRCERPEVIFSNLFHSNILCLLARAAAGLRAPVIIRQANAALQYHDESVMRWLMARLYPRADVIVAPSQGVKDDLVRDFGLAEERVRVIHNPVDCQCLARLAREPVPLALNGRVPVIACASRLEPQKGIDYLLEAFAHVRRERVARLLLVGDGTERRRLEAKAETLGLAEDVVFAGYQKNPFAWLRHATVFVLPSLFEGFPNALLEALALGLPAVAAACPHGPGEIVEDGRSGLLVPPADSAALARALLDVLNDARLRAKLGEEARKRAEQFSVAKAMEEYEALFANLARGSARGVAGGQ